MPIPVNQLEQSPPEPGRFLQLVPHPARSRRFLLFPRVFAHLVDICVVNGLSVYSAKLFSLVLISFHVRAIDHSNRARPVFLEAFAYSSTEMTMASLAVIGLMYFVALPFAVGRTPGLGLFGLRIRSDEGPALTLRQLMLRYGGCVLTYATFGLLFLAGLRRRDGRFVQDRLSGTSVVPDRS